MVFYLKNKGKFTLRFADMIGEVLTAGSHGEIKYFLSNIMFNIQFTTL